MSLSITRGLLTAALRSFTLSPRTVAPSCTRTRPTVHNLGNNLRHYSSKKSRSHSTTESTSQEFNISTHKTKMEQSVQWLKKELAALRTGRANPSLLENVIVVDKENHGSKRKLKEMATVSLRDATTLVIHVFDPKTAPAITSSIRSSLNVTPSSQSPTTLLVSLPPPTMETRKSLVKTAHTLLEKSRIGLRSSREDAKKEIKGMSKKGGVSVDETRKWEKEVDSVSEKIGKELDALVKAKEKEIVG